MTAGPDSGCPVAGGRDREAALLEAGWVRRFVAAPPRLEEVVGVYRSLGHEIRIEPLDVDGLDARCVGCGPGLAECRAVYTRPGRPTGALP